MAGVRTPDAVFPESVHEVIVSVELFEFIAPPDCTNGSSKSSTKPNELPQRKKQYSQRALVRPAASGSVKEKVVLQTTRTSTYRILMPEKSAIESMMPQARSPEAKKGGRGVQ